MYQLYFDDYDITCNRHVDQIIKCTKERDFFMDHDCNIKNNYKPYQLTSPPLPSQLPPATEIEQIDLDEEQDIRVVSDDSSGVRLETIVNDEQAEACGAIEGVSDVELPADLPSTLSENVPAANVVSDANITSDQQAVRPRRSRKKVERYF